MRPRPLHRAALNAVAVVTTVFFAFPVYWMLATSLKRPGDVISTGYDLIPTSVTVRHYIDAVHKANFLTYVRNSLTVTLTTVVVAVAVALLAGTALARLRFRGRATVVVIILVAQMAPFEALLIPYFLTMRDLNLLNRLPALVLIYYVVVLPFTTWTLRGFIAAVPRELEEAALVDGCTRFGAFWRVVFPLLAPGLVATSIFGFITAWNEFLYAFVLMSDQTKYTLPVWLQTFQTAFGTDWGGTMAASTIFTLPVLIFFLAIQRRNVSGLTAGAVKG